MTHSMIRRPDIIFSRRGAFHASRAPSDSWKETVHAFKKAAAVLKSLPVELGRMEDLARSCISSRMHNNILDRRRVEISVDGTVNFDLG